MWVPRAYGSWVLGLPWQDTSQRDPDFCLPFHWLYYHVTPRFGPFDCQTHQKCSSGFSVKGTSWPHQGAVEKSHCFQNQSKATVWGWMQGESSALTPLLSLGLLERARSLFKPAPCWLFWQHSQEHSFLCRSLLHSPYARGLKHCANAKTPKSTRFRVKKNTPHRFPSPMTSSVGMTCKLICSRWTRTVLLALRFDLWKWPARFPSRYIRQ